MDALPIEGLVAASLLSKTLTFLVASASLYFFLRFFDRRNGIKWGKIYEGFENDPIAAARYFGARVIAFAVLAGIIYG